MGIAVESTFNWYWLVDGLMDAGYRVHLVNTSVVKKYEGLKYTNDKTDTFWLAHMLRLGILPTGYIYPKGLRPVRDLLRKRTQLVELRTTNILSIQNLWIRNTGVDRGIWLTHETPMIFKKIASNGVTGVSSNITTYINTVILRAPDQL